MRNILATLAIAAATAMPAVATPQSPDFINGGQCAGDAYSKCHYTLDIVNPNEAMVYVPHLEFLGRSRISTVNFCAELNKVQDWKDMSTDAELEGFEACLTENT